MAATTDEGVEVNHALEQRVMSYLTSESIYISCAGTLVERLVADLANSREEVMAFETTISRLIRNDNIVLGELEPDDLNADPRSLRPGLFVHRVIWVE